MAWSVSAIVVTAAPLFAVEAAAAVATAIAMAVSDTAFNYSFEIC